MDPQKFSNLPLIFAHRGRMADAYENSFEAFRKVLEIPIDGIETDAWLTRDEKIVLHHDRVITHGHSIDIPKSDSQIITRVLLPNGEHIPTLDDLISLLDSKILLSIDIQNLKLGPQIIRSLSNHAILDRTFICCDTLTKSKRIREYSRETMICLSLHNLTDVIGSSNFIKNYNNLKIFALNCKYEDFSLEMLNFIEKNKLVYFLWNFDSPEKIQEFANFQGKWKFLKEKKKPLVIYTDFPIEAIRILRKIEK